MLRLKHRDLKVWQEAMALVKLAYMIIAQFPGHELYGLASQTRRAAIAIPCNIAEGAARNSKTQFLQFLNIARGSLSELETQLLIARDLGYVADGKEWEEGLEKVFALLSALIRTLQWKQP